MATTTQYVELTVTTDSNGEFNFSFDNHIDAVVAGVNAPQVGGNQALVGVSAQVTGDKSVHCRAWVSGTTPSWSVQPANAKQITVTLIGLSS